MNIKTDDYRIAPLNGNDQTLNAIKAAEAEIAEITGKEVTLIAYEKTDKTKR
ncbi:hypothetical protein [Paenibacillus sp. DMB20]|uniref:hypothetical protein n=1 Tax=Paenibacillus sp. DMB20 TaxID=1642570 RepID=UPI000AC67168|nr:hypothetical protein [Paenibacillus sp. DMB20]